MSISLADAGAIKKRKEDIWSESMEEQRGKTRVGGRGKQRALYKHGPKIQSPERAVSQAI